MRTFVEGYKNPEKRVQAQEWLEALKPIIEKFESETVQCKNNHYYFKHLSYCPYCEVQQKILGAMNTIDGDKGDDTKLVETKDKSQKKHTVGWMICWCFLMICTAIDWMVPRLSIKDFGGFGGIPFSRELRLELPSAEIGQILILLILIKMIVLLVILTEKKQ